ncbi:MAG: hypothetical protein LDL19_05510 [Thiobacillus sp.]|nr:hypothetical protein [Thiobacillus sp.]
MNPMAKISALIALACLDAGLASANGTEPGPDEHAAPPAVVASAPATPAVSGASSSHAMMPLPSLPAMAPVAPVWLQVPASGLRPYYVVPQAGGMAWSVAPAFPAPPVPPARMLAPSGWVPYVLVLVPVQPSAPAQVDYGPVAETPVVPLPEPETPVPPVETEIRGADAVEPPAVAAPAIVAAPPAAVPAAENAPPVPATPAPAAASAPAIESQGPVPMKAAEPVAAPVQLAVEAKSAAAPADVDYGPVAPTPVVDLLAVAASPAPRSAVPSTAGRTVKPVVKKPAAARPAAVPPARKRMCWSNGVVSPCK